MDLQIWHLILIALIGYPFGAMQFAYFVSKRFGKIDIREHGSGNAGTTNVTRVLGPRLGLVVLFFDILKTIVPIIILHIILYGRPWYLEGLPDFDSTFYIPGLVMGLGITLGHCFPFFLKFRGGKGVANMIGILMMFDPRIIAIVLSISLVIVLITRFISLASVTGFLSLGIVTTYLYADYPQIFGVMWILCILGVINHRKNIKWLITGEEKRFNFKKKKA
ncbi:MAG: glycerol-3-phosphate 1-O-acyltransferase PlsY [Defluviitaleaceae bacterium]|nr:glycerol-3-phosphate 1-O-acyltransferase PlsY [Defluviitaleaceae bacterium]